MVTNEVRPGTSYFDSNAGRAYLADDPHNRLVETAIARAALVGFSTYQLNVTVRGLVIEKSANTLAGSNTHAVMAGQGWLVEGNQIRLNSGGGVSVSSRVVVRDNHVHHNDQYGSSGGGDHILIEGNEIAPTTTLGSMATSTPAGRSSSGPRGTTSIITRATAYLPAWTTSTAC